MKRLLIILAGAILIPSFGITGSSQTDRVYQAPGGKFKLNLISEWREVSYADAVGRQKTEFVYRDRSEGLLRVSREKLSGRPLSNLVQDEEENLRLYRAGYETASKEPFGAQGSLSGIRFSFYNLDGGKRIAGTNYYLQDGDSVWILKFTGKRGVIDTIRNITDQMARSFKPE